MHIIVPMSGVGQRFLDAGYKDPKPLIVVDGMPIIEHVCNLFPGEEKFTFICNSQHLSETNMREVLLSIKPETRIVEIPNHKLGPVYAVSLVEDLIEDDEEVIVNYCDFGTYWDYQDFLKHTRDRGADGAVPSYIGFHPHMLGSTNYAFMRDKKQMMLEIKEKEPFTTDRMNEFASNGTYYFRKGLYVKQYFQSLMDQGLSLNGEYYVSLVYNLLVKDGLKVSIYNVQHMLQWGTPDDVMEYKAWSQYFKDVCRKEGGSHAPENNIALIPLAGHGSRFSKDGYSTPKPLIEVSGKPMIVQAANSLPDSQSYTFVALKDHLDRYQLGEAIKTEYPDASIIPITGVTEGQAITCSLGLGAADNDASLIIAATDNGMTYSDQKYKCLVEDENVDAIIFTFKGHVSSANNPHMYGWVKVDINNCATSVSVKKPVSDSPRLDHAIVGTFWFRKVGYFKRALEQLLDNNTRVNGEYYVDSLMGELIDLGFNVKVFEVDNYICWGTPNDYRTFVYWQSLFHKAPWHPYSLEIDPTVNQSKVDQLDKEYRLFGQRYR